MVGGKLIKHEQKVKYLGLTLDRRLNWRTHINQNIDLCKEQLISLTNRYRNTSKAKAKLMNWIYTGVIRPKIAYGCMIWAHNIATKLIHKCCLLYTSPSPRDRQKSRMPSSA